MNRDRESDSPIVSEKTGSGHRAGLPCNKRWAGYDKRQERIKDCG
jgi:hypothetical protein